MTERQKEVINKMLDGEWYTPRDLGTNERCLELLRKNKVVKRREGAGWGSQNCTDSLNVREEYQLVAA